ncbi:MAG: hypothetical protein GX262_01790 [Clostridia bacterium]|nr:hypothetical protein [Clostridia bacterium]
MGKQYLLPPIRQIRDLTIIDLNNGESLVVACDSAGAVGPKELDEVKVSNYILGRFIFRVALIEVVASGALPIVVTDALAVEMNPSGAEIIAGIKDELKDLGMENQVQLTGSTEENFVAKQSGIGITVIGIGEKEKLRLVSAKPGDELLCLGLPKLGAEVELTDPEIITTKIVLDLLTYPEIHEVVPVGSKGILYEARTLAKTNGMELELNPECTLPLEKSGGPSTCVLAATAPGFKDQLTKSLPLPVNLIGKIK